MPRNRQGTPRDHRVSEVIIAARELFLSRGFSKTPMLAVANAVGIQPGAVYWYFRTKDHLLAEVWNRALDQEIERLKKGPEDPFERLAQGLIDLRPYRQLHMAMHDRMGDSDVIVAAHDRLIGWVRQLVMDGLDRHGYSRAEERDLVDLVVVLFEGTNVPGIRSRTATDVIMTLLDRLGLRSPSASCGSRLVAGTLAGSRRE